MNGISTFLEESDPNFGAPRFDEEHDGILVTELVEHEETKEIVKRHTTHIPDDSIISWLNRTEHFEHNGSQACRVFDIIWINGNIESWPWTIEIKRSNQELILDNFGLRKARQLVPPCGGFIHLPPETGTRSDLATFALYVYERVVLVWAFNKDTYRTHAICWNSNPWFPQDKMQEILEGQLHLVRHPLFLGLGAAIHMSGLNEADIGQTRDQIQAVEARTFHSPFYKDHRFGRVGSYTSLSGEMSGCVTYLACTKTELSIIREVLDFVSRNQFSGMIEQVKGPEKAMFEARKCAIVLRQRLESQEREIQYLTRRAEVQITALFNFITQQETRVSISVAQDSRTLAAATRQDSNAMKTLAAVTVIFLPSTYVAALFSMPLFQWGTETAGDTLVSKYFWIYWAVSIPLTILTLSLWFIWMRLQTRRHRDQDAEQIASLDDETNSHDKGQLKSD